MSLDNIQLPPFLIQELYKNSMVDTAITQKETESLDKEIFQFLGKNEKKILIVVDDQEAVYLQDELLNFLIEILEACKLSLSDTALINFDKNKSINYQVLQHKFKPSIILFFGIDPATLDFPLQFPHYQLQVYNKQTYLSAPSLQLISTQRAEKANLWACLKKLFNI